MKKILILFALSAAVFLSGCTHPEGPAAGEGSYDDGIYRGAFFDKNRMEVGLEITLKDNVVTAVSFRYLNYRETDFLRGEGAAAVVKKQFGELTEYLVGRDVRKALDDLYTPGNIIQTEVDGLTGATIRAGKVISAVRDALNRGVYSRP